MQEKGKMKKRKTCFTKLSTKYKQYCRENYLCFFRIETGRLTNACLYFFQEHLDFSEKNHFAGLYELWKRIFQNNKELQETCPTAKVLEGIEIKKKAVESEETKRLKMVEDRIENRGFWQRL